MTSPSSPMTGAATLQSHEVAISSSSLVELVDFGFHNVLLVGTKGRSTSFQSHRTTQQHCKIKFHWTQHNLDRVSGVIQCYPCFFNESSRVTQFNPQAMQLILSNSYCEVSCNSSQSAKVALVTVTCSAARSTWKLNRYESRWVPYVPLGKWTKNGNWEPSVSVYFFFRFFFDPNFLHIRNKQQTKRRYKNHGQLWSLTVFSCNMKWRPLTQFVWNSDQLYFWKVVFQK